MIALGHEGSCSKENQFGRGGGQKGTAIIPLNLRAHGSFPIIQVEKERLREEKVPTCPKSNSESEPRSPDSQGLLLCLSDLMNVSVSTSSPFKVLIIVPNHSF